MDFSKSFAYHKMPWYTSFHEEKVSCGGCLTSSQFICIGFRKTTLQFVSGFYTFIRCHELSFLVFLFTCSLIWKEVGYLNLKLNLSWIWAKFKGLKYLKKCLSSPCLKVMSGGYFFVNNNVYCPLENTHQNVDWEFWKGVKNNWNGQTL